MSLYDSRRKSIEEDKENMKNALRNWRKVAQKQHESPFKPNVSIEPKKSFIQSSESEYKYIHYFIEALTVVTVALVRKLKITEENYKPKLIC